MKQVYKITSAVLGIPLCALILVIKDDHACIMYMDKLLMA